MIEKEQHLPFCTRLVRGFLPGGICHYYGKEGETEPPREEDTPSVRYLAYGSSITHGSLSLILPFSYPFLIAEALGVDCINQGYAGSAFMEALVAEYMVSRKDWDFATLIIRKGQRFSGRLSIGMQRQKICFIRMVCICWTEIIKDTLLVLE